VLRRGLLLLVLAVAIWPAAPLRAEMAATIAHQTTQSLTQLETNDQNVDLSVVQNTQVGGSADAEAHLYESLENSVVSETDGQNTAHIGDSFSGMAGIVSVNQSPGSSNNQGNMVSFAYAEADFGLALISGASAEVINRDNSLEASGTSRMDVIDAGAFQDMRGALQVNQSSGSLNNQNNILAVAAGTQGAGIQGIVALSNAALGQQVARNNIREMMVTKIDMIAAGAFNNACGIVSVNQSSGCGNNQTNVVIITVRQAL
jgi:hypothetical protein